MSSIEKELQTLTGISQQRRESDQAYLERIVKALNDVSDSKYNKLSKDAQTWAEEATEAYNAKDEISAFPEAEDGEDEDHEEEARPRRAARGRRDEAEAETETESEDEPEEGNDEDEDQPEDDDMPATRTDEDEAPRKRGAKTAPARKTAPAASKSKTAAKDGKGGAPAKAGGGLTYVRELLVKDPDITVPNLAEKVKAKGFTVSVQTLHTTRSGFRQDLRVLQDAGLLKRKLV